MRRNVYLLLLSFLMAAPLKGATHSLKGFAFDYDPTHWAASDKLTQDDAQKIYRTLVAFQRKTDSSEYSPRFSVVRESLEKVKGQGPDPLTAYHRYALNFMRSQRFGNFQVRSGKDILPKLGVQAYETIANQRDFGLTFRQVIFVKGKDAYLLTAAVQTKSLAKHKKEMDKFFSTFRTAK